MTNGRQLSGAFTVAKSGDYFFRFLAGTRIIARGAAAPIHALADEPPRVTVISPAAQLEVPSSQVVGLQYQASDDYGLSLIELVYRLPGAQTEIKLVLRKPSEAPHRLDGHADFDLGTLRLFPGDELTYAISATDNDAILGPKSTRSAPHTIHIYSQAEHHQNALARVRTLWERLIGLLGDRLEEQVRRGSDLGNATERAKQLSRDLELEARAELKERLGITTLPTALINIARDEQRRLAATVDASEDGVAHAGETFQRALAEEVSGLERDVLYLEALLDETSGAELLGLANELADRKKDLATLLERYRRAPTTALQTQIEALLSRLKERTAQLGAQVQHLAKEGVDQHFNREALEALRKGKDLDASVAETRQLVESGDLAGALKSLEQLGSRLDNLRKEIANSQNDGPNRYAALGKELVRFKTQLEQLKADQEELAKSTAGIREEARRTREQRTPMTDAQIAKLQTEAREAQHALGLVPPAALPQSFASEEGLPEAREPLAGLAAALESRDFAQALRSTNEALRAVGDLTRLTTQGALYDAFDPATPSGHAAAVTAARSHLAEASSPLRRIRETLQGLFPGETGQLTERQRAKLDAIAKRQDRASAASSQLGRQLQQIAQDAPVFDRGAQDTLQRAGERMRSAGGKLDQKDPTGALEDQRGAIADLDRLARAMKGQGGSPGAGGVPNPFALERDANDGDGSNGGDSPPEAVVVPDADQYQVPAQFRRDILDAMKQAPPVPYQDQVKRYYQEIVK